MSIRPLTQHEGREGRTHDFGRSQLSGAAITFAAALMGVAAIAFTVALMLATNASAATSPVQIASATVNADRSVSVDWNVPAGSFGGALIINSTSTTDFR